MHHCIVKSTIVWVLMAGDLLSTLQKLISFTLAVGVDKVVVKVDWARSGWILAAAAYIISYSPYQVQTNP